MATTWPREKIEAGFTKKNDVYYHGYKPHAAVDVSRVITGVAASTTAFGHGDSEHRGVLQPDQWA